MKGIRRALEAALMTAVLFAMPSCGGDNEGAETPPGKDTPPATKTVSGMIEKGPFAQGSKVTLYELKGDLSQTGKSFKTQTNSNLGAFKVEGIELQSQYVELETNGYFYNEVTGEMSVAPISLNALSDVTNRNSVNVNIITHLEFERVKNLVKGGSSFSSAKKQAEKELLRCFAITDEISAPEGISITDNNRNASILLAISTIMLYNRSEGEFTAFLAKFTTDFADNGVIDDTSVRNGIAEGQENAHPSAVIEMMKDYFAKHNQAITCDDFSQYIDFNGDGVIDENDGEANEELQPAEPDIIYSEGQVRQALAGTYDALARFVHLQMAIEHARLNKTASSVNPSSAGDNTLYEAWTAAYQTIQQANAVIRGLKNVGWDTTLPYYYAEAHAIRSFAYYQLAQLWGNVPVINGDEDMMTPQRQRSQEEVLKYAMQDAETARGTFGQRNPWGDQSHHFAEAHVNILLAELMLTVQWRTEAQAFLQISEEGRLDIGETIYDPAYVEALREEASDHTEDLAAYWKDRSGIASYGVWAALKRLGEAQAVSGCSDYELLLPIPEKELWTNPMMVQNPGY